MKDAETNEGEASVAKYYRRRNETRSATVIKITERLKKNRPSSINPETASIVPSRRRVSVSAIRDLRFYPPRGIGYKARR